MESNYDQLRAKALEDIEKGLNQYDVKMYDGDGAMRPFGEMLQDLSFAQALPPIKIVKIGNWKLIWCDGKYIGALKYRGDTRAKQLGEDEWRSLSVFAKILNLFN